MLYTALAGRGLPYACSLSIRVRTVLLPGRRVHITSVTLEHLKGAYLVEDGEGQERDPYLKEHRVITHLVINPKVINHLQARVLEVFNKSSNIIKTRTNSSLYSNDLNETATHTT